MHDSNNAPYKCLSYCVRVTIGARNYFSWLYPSSSLLQLEVHFHVMLITQKIFCDALQVVEPMHRFRSWNLASFSGDIVSCVANASVLRIVSVHLMQNDFCCSVLRKRFRFRVLSWCFYVQGSSEEGLTSGTDFPSATYDHTSKHPKQTIGLNNFVFFCV